MSIRPEIPDVQGVKDEAATKILKAIKSAFDNITGRSQPRIRTLGASANFFGAVKKINEIIHRIQGETGPELGAVTTIPDQTGTGGGTGTGSVTSVATGTGLTGGPITSSGTISLADTAVTPGSYTYSSFTVDQQGRITNAASGAAPTGTVTSVSWTGGIVSIADPTTTPAFTIAGTSGGIPYFASGTTWASTGALTANALMLGGGAGAAPSTLALGTQRQQLEMNSGATAPQWQSWPQMNQTVGSGKTMTVDSGFSVAMLGPLVASGDIVLNGDLCIL